MVEVSVRFCFWPEKFWINGGENGALFLFLFLFISLSLNGCSDCLLVGSGEKENVLGGNFA